MRELTEWNGERCEAECVRVIVGPCEKETYWYNGLEGTERRAVRIEYQGHTFYIDNDKSPKGYLGRVWQAGEGWDKVTIGRGSPQWGHASLPVAKDLGREIDLEIAAMTNQQPKPKREDFPSRQAFRRAQQLRSKPHAGAET